MTFDIFSMWIGFGIGVIIMLIYCNVQLQLVADRYEETIAKQKKTINSIFTTSLRDYSVSLLFKEENK